MYGEGGGDSVGGKRGSTEGGVWVAGTTLGEDMGADAGGDDKGKVLAFVSWEEV
jgi:hypothetical protein